MRILTSLLALTITANWATAQTTRLIPASAGREGSSAQPTLFSQGAGRIQQIVDGNAVMNTLARITSIRLRMDGTRMTSAAVRTLRGFKLSLGYTSTSPAMMSRTFSANRTGAQTLVFDGTLVLPTQTDKSRPFNIDIRFNKVTSFNFDKANGNLLIEMELPGTAQTDFGYMVDAHAQSTRRGFYTDYGTPGKLSNGEFARILVQDDFNLRPGRTFTISVSALRQGYPTVAFLGGSGTNFGPLRLPFALDGLGATGNVLEISPDIPFPVTLIQSGNTFVGSLRIPIPAGAFGLRLYSQFLFLDRNANSFGAALSPGLAVWAQATSQPVQYVHNRDSTAATGSSGNAGEGLVLELQGVFR